MYKNEHCQCATDIVCLDIVVTILSYLWFFCFPLIGNVEISLLMIQKVARIICLIDCIFLELVFFLLYWLLRQREKKKKTKIKTRKIEKKTNQTNKKPKQNKKPCKI